jgi:hypothetical protein
MQNAHIPISHPKAVRHKQNCGSTGHPFQVVRPKLGVVVVANWALEELQNISRSNESMPQIFIFNSSAVHSCGSGFGLHSGMMPKSQSLKMNFVSVSMSGSVGPW